LARAAPGELAAIDERLRACHAQGSAAWPDVALAEDAFVDAIARHLESGAFALPEVHAGDFYLAAACAAGIPGAVVALERAFLQRIPEYVAHVVRSSDPVKVEDVAQEVAERVVVPTAARAARIADYAGRGPLGAWLRVLSVRLALNLKRRSEPPSEPPAADVPVGDDPELDLFRLKYGADFKAALEASFAELDDEQRVILRLHASGEHRGEDIARILGIDRSTAMRRLARARETLFSTTKRLMIQKLGIDTAEFESIARAVHSRLELSLSRLLATRP
jgi:RNA polymerase sigma-70 factor (ECF subfamily)